MRARRGVVAGVVAVVAAVAVYLWDDLVLAAPIVAAERVWGAVPAFVVFSVWYAVGSYIIAVLLVRWADRDGEQPDNVLSRWAASQASKRRSTWGERLVHVGSVGAFVLSSVVIGGILTTWFVHLSGRRDGIRRVAAASSAIFGVSFAALYTLVGVGIGQV